VKCELRRLRRCLSALRVDGVRDAIVESESADGSHSSGPVIGFADRSVAWESVCGADLHVRLVHETKYAER